jgi:formylmethanofuran:tetrahydromethanopterin formyltransferase
MTDSNIYENVESIIHIAISNLERRSLYGFDRTGIQTSDIQGVTKVITPPLTLEN